MPDITSFILLMLVETDKGKRYEDRFYGFLQTHFYGNSHILI